MRSLFITIFILSFISASAQIGIGTLTPHSSAQLELWSTSKGLLIPRVSLSSLTDAATITTPSNSLLIFNTNAAVPGGTGYYYNSGTPAVPAWLKLQTGTSGGWSLTGNSGTNPASNFIGTSDNQPLNFRVDNQKAGRIDQINQSVFLGYKSGEANTGKKNTFIGDQVGSGNTTGDDNTGLGFFAQYANTTGSKNTAIGSLALHFSTASNNTAVGYASLYANTTGQFNTAIGTNALQSNNIGAGNTVLGYNAGFSNTTGADNIFIGANSGNSNLEASDNIAIGSGSLSASRYGGQNVVIGKNAGNLGDFASFDNNVLIGTEAGYHCNNANNVFIGYRAGYENAGFDFNYSGQDNTFIGSYAGYNNSPGTNNDGSQNTYIGRSAGYLNVTGEDNAFMGFNSGYKNDGDKNVYLGSYCGYDNTTGYNNVFSGYQAGYNNDSGFENTFIGSTAGNGNTSGQHNAALGFDAGGSNTTGDNNTYLGYSAEGNSGVYNNSTAIGYQASVTASNKIRIGNGSITEIGGQVGWSTLSDGRLKKNIQPSTLGLNFIKQLTPVTYNYTDTGQCNNLYTGFIAQDVERILNEMGIDFSGITKPQNENDHYSIRYGEFVVPLVKAMQEQQAVIESLEASNLEMKIKLEELEAKVEGLIKGN